MKTLKVILLTCCVFIASFSLISCLDDDDKNYPSTVVTVYPEEDGSFYLATDNGNTLELVSPVNFKPKKVQRALAILSILDNEPKEHDYVVQVMYLDTFLTKSIVDNLGEENESVYGNDPVTIHECWIGDGFLNIYFGTYWGGGATHFVNLIQTNDVENPYELEFRHNRYDDPKTEFGSSLVAYDLASLPDTEGETVDLNVTVNTYNGKGIIKLKYNSAKNSSEISNKINGLSLENKMKYERLN